MARPGRNDLCHCGSGKKYKRCHEPGEREQAGTSRVLMLVVGVAVAAAVVAGAVAFTGESSAGTRIWDPAHGHYHDANGMEVP